MNIGLITLVTPAESNGLSNYIKYLIKGLSQIDSKNNYYIILNTELDKFLDFNHPNFKKIFVEIPHYPRAIMRPYYFLWQNIFFKEIIRRFELDIVHFPNPVPVWAKYNIPCVFTIHDTAELNNLRNGYLKQRFRILVNRLSAKRAKEVITVSEFSKQQIEHLMGVDKNMIHVTHPGLTIHNESIHENEQYDIEPYFLFLGGFQKHKNVDRVISAFLKFRKNSKSNLVIVGKGGPKLNSKKDVEFRKNGIIYKGIVSSSKLKGLYKNALALIYPSLFEGFGLPILEAMSAGIPVITSNRSAMPEVAGNAALLINPESEDEILDAMRKSQDLNTKEFLRSQGFKNLERFNWANTATKTLKVYERAYHSFNLKE